MNEDAVKMPKVGIIVLNWNRKNDTLECLESIAKSTYSDYEVIVADNGSFDGSVPAIREFFPNVFIIENHWNLGFAEGNNRAITFAVGRGCDYIVLLNNDAVIDADALSTLVTVAERNPDAGVIGPLILYYQTDDKIWSSGGMMDYQKGDWIKVAGETLKEKFYEVDALSGCCMMFRAHALVAIGPFDEKFFLYGEDIDICLRLKKKGFRILCVPPAKVWHKVGQSIQGSESPDYIYYNTRNRLLLMEKHAAVMQLLFFLPYFMYSVCIRQAFFFARDKQFDNVKAIYQGTFDFFLHRFGKRK